MKKTMIAVLLAVALLPAAPERGEGAVVPMDVPALTDSATLVVRGRVGAGDVHWREDARGNLIVTDWRIDVGEVLKGRLADRSITLHVEGGRIGDLTCRSAEEPKVAAGEEVVLFLSAHPYVPGAWRTQGGFQGKLTLLDDRVREMKDRGWSSLRAEISERVRQGR